MSDRLALLAFVIMALLLLALMAAQAQRAEAVSSLDRSFKATARPVWEGVLGVAGGLQRVWENYLYVVGVRKEREQLLAKVNQLEAERQQTREIWLENQRLRQLLALKDESAFPKGVVARVVADLSSGPLRRAVLVNRGDRDGISTGWVALSRGALVGRVSSVAGHSAEILLISDPDSGVSVRHQLDRFVGILRGGNRGPAVMARLDFVPRDQAVAVGDTVVTSGLDGVFPPGLLVGYVREMEGNSPLSWGILVEVAADAAHLEEVMLVPPTYRPPTPPSERAPIQTVAPPVDRNGAASPTTPPAVSPPAATPTTTPSPDAGTPPAPAPPPPPAGEPDRPPGRP